ncbi:hypothetical protein PBI_IRONMAN_41 [Mycobacterium phage IronMan]|uniref:Uncharacterized protein n=1 Tax=Mycobacterium phage IronMan TaxID=2499042 RepID=A0A3S9UD65_9CAUD|nr:hypothetical protein KI247_gp60 [Mycobacterium phage IronMan]AZS08243.1 hypothetical protein PBI_IRONMAN_41 [Mycobacterium phage IronMan]
MSLGYKFASIIEVTDEAVLAVGEKPILDHALADFRKLADKHPEVCVVFDHTIRQSVHQDWHRFMRQSHLVRTEAMVIRAQLAIEA